METKAFSELFPFLSNASPETLEWLLSIAVTEEYSPNSEILREDDWGKAVYLIVSGWVKIQRQVGDQKITQDVLGRGGFFGEMGILGESPRATVVIALSDVELMSISAQRFIQTLFKEPHQIQHRFLQLMVQRLHRLQNRWYRRYQPPNSRLNKILVSLSEDYGQPGEQGVEIYQIPEQDLADLAEITVEETQNILENLVMKGLLTIDSTQETICLTNPKQLIHLSRKNIE